MKHLSILIAMLLFMVSPLLAQHNAELDKRNGFKDIKLGTPVAILFSIAGA